MPLRETLSGYWRSLQGELFPALEAELGPLGERYFDLVTVLELARVEASVKHRPHDPLARARQGRLPVMFGILALSAIQIMRLVQ